MTIVYTKPLKDIIHVHAESQFELTSTFVRLQEFYESPYDNIRGNYGWSLQKLAQTYVDHGQPFDYFSKWNGMNVPGHVVTDFFGNFDDLSPDEVKLAATLWRAFLHGINQRRFYLIGTWKEEDITHELAHAMFYLDSDYRKEMQDLVCGLKMTQTSVLEATESFLRQRGYSETVFCDETQAYLATSTIEYLSEKMGSCTGPYVFMRAKPFREVFKRFSGKEPL